MRWVFWANWQIRSFAVVVELYSIGVEMAGVIRARTGDEKLAGPARIFVAPFFHLAVRKGRESSSRSKTQR
jgi:hypothetical protein